MARVLRTVNSALNSKSGRPRLVSVIDICADIKKISDDLDTQVTSTPSSGIADNSTLLGWGYVQSFRLVSSTRNTDGVLLTANIVWPDGATGVFTTDTVNTTFVGAIDAWHATYIKNGVTKTMTQPTVTRDAGGAVTAQPSIVVS